MTTTHDAGLESAVNKTTTTTRTLKHLSTQHTGMQIYNNNK